MLKFLDTQDAKQQHIQPKLFLFLRNNYLLKNQGRICACVYDVAEYLTGKWLAYVNGSATRGYLVAWLLFQSYFRSNSVYYLYLRGCQVQAQVLLIKEQGKGLHLMGNWMKCVFY
jgi:hypothetical protein